MPPSPLATAADYADAMMIARRAKNWLFLLLLLFLLIQLSAFFVARMTDYVMAPVESIGDRLVVATTLPTTAPASARPAEVRDRYVRPVLEYVTSGINVFGIVLVGAGLLVARLGERLASFAWVAAGVALSGLTAIVYGLITYVVMNLIVVPLRFHAPLPPKALSIATQLFAHIVLVGLPFTLIARRYIRR